MSVRTEQELIQELLDTIQFLVKELDDHAVKADEMIQLEALILKWSEKHPELMSVLREAIDRNQKSLN